MITRTLPPAPTLAQATRRLIRAADGAASVRLVIPVQSPGDPLDWLAHTPPGQRLFWSDPSGHSVAGWGVLDVRQRLPQAEGLRYFGGMAFDPDADRDGHWAPFGQQRFWLPMITLETDEGGQRLVATALERPIRTGRLLATHSPAAALVGHVEHHAPGHTGWCEGIGAAIDGFRRGEMSKVVLARQTAVALDAPVDPFALLMQLSQPGCFVFGFEVAEGHAFVGCSPERLFRRSGRALTTEALAGTRRRGHTRQQDAMLAAELKADAKERVEHHHVVEAIEADLAPLCTELRRDDAPGIRRLRSVQHLHTPFVGTLAEGVTDGDLLAAMHPTPAVCGRPTHTARQFIRQAEPFDRGWYAGPVGWVDGDQAEFAVAIRSALLHGSTMRFCTGAGIVEASRADAEWSELDAKSARLVGLLHDSVSRSAG